MHEKPADYLSNDSRCYSYSATGYLLANVRADISRIVFEHYIRGNILPLISQHG